LTVVVSATALPSSSTAETWVVPCSGGSSCATGEACSPNLAPDLAGEVLGDHAPDPLFGAGVEVGIAEVLAERVQALLGLDHRVQEALRPVPAGPRLLALQHVEQRREMKPPLEGSGMVTIRCPRYDDSIGWRSRIWTRARSSSERTPPREATVSTIARAILPR